jgi:BMFP domain-containing protein YqiC
VHEPAPPVRAEKQRPVPAPRIEKPKPKPPPELVEIEAEIAILEERVAELERRLAEDWQDVNAVAAHRAARAKLAELLARWETLFEGAQA